MPALAALSDPPLDLPPVRKITLAELGRCLGRAIGDVAAAPGPTLMHGALAVAGGILVLALAGVWPALLPGGLSVFVLVAPILATGLYELARQHEAGRQGQFADVWAAWRRGAPPLVQLGLLLALAALAWVGFSALVFGLFIRVPITEPEALLRYVVLGQGDQLFVLWTLLGGLGAATVFAVTAVSVPLLLERRIGLRRAILTSVRAVGDNPLVMGLWAALILVASLVGIATAMLGFIFVVPVAGCATWHLYRALVDADYLPLRD